MKLELTLPDGLKVVRIEAIPDSDADRRLAELEGSVRLLIDDALDTQQDVADLQRAEKDIRSEIKGGPFRNVSE